MKILIIGSGAREHAIAWKVRTDPRVRELSCAPGNAGTALLGRNLPISASDVEALAAWAAIERPDLTIVGPEAPLAAGIVDEFGRRGLPIFGPSKAASRIESSKCWAKDLMQRHGIPHARGEAFSNCTGAVRFIQGSKLPVVVKADGLAGGKGVVVARTHEEAVSFVTDLIERETLSEAGKRVIIEETLSGVEASVLCFTDGYTIQTMATAQDYKRAYDKDQGPNTGGMGAIAPSPRVSREMLEQIEREILQPTVDAMRREGSLFRGVLYAGLMLTDQGPKVLEFNCRFGDPETQVVLPLLQGSLLDVMFAVVGGTLAGKQLCWVKSHCCGVVLASTGYPGSYKKGLAIRGIESVDPGVFVFHAGTRQTEGGAVVTDGGRVLTVVGTGGTLAAAREVAYSNVPRIEFEGKFYRTDIGG